VTSPVPERTLGRAGIAGVACLVGLCLVAALAPWITLGDPSATGDVVGTRYLAPLAVDRHGVFHLLGTDKLGRDVWTRLAWGARVSLGVGLLAVCLSVGIGALVGAAAGAGRGALSRGLLAITDFALALPRVVVLLLLATLWTPGALLVVLVLGLTGWMPVARLVHGEVRSLMARPFVEGALALGAGRSRLLMRHLLPNAVTPVIAAATLGVGNAITLEAGLSFLGLGVQPPAPSWGGMIASGRDALINAPWVALAPGLALVLVVVACTLVGDALLEDPGQGS
jgi:peptide/nickel transport system permease protein